MLKGLRCCEILETIQKYSILVCNVGAWSRNCHHPLIKSRGAVMVRHDGVRSQPCTTIHYTCNETWEGLRCCETLGITPNPNILHLGVKRRGLLQACHHPQLERQGVVMVILDEFKSQPCTTIHYTCNETLEGLRCCETLGITPNILHLGVKRRGLLSSLSPPATGKAGCGDGYT